MSTKKEEVEAILAASTIQTYRASGKGGQHINKVETAVRLLHNPSGIVVTAQKERSQYLNKLLAAKKVIAILHERQKKRKLRIATSKSFGVKQQEAESKKLHSQRKSNRSKKDISSFED